MTHPAHFIGGSLHGSIAEVDLEVHYYLKRRTHEEWYKITETHDGELVSFMVLCGLPKDQERSMKQVVFGGRAKI